MFQKPTPAELLNRFSHHPPTVEKAALYSKLRDKFFQLATDVVDSTPCCPEQTRALNKLEEAMFLANASIARNGEG